MGWSFGIFMLAAVGNLGGSGSLPLKRSGCCLQEDGALLPEREDGADVAVLAPV